MNSKSLNAGELKLTERKTLTAADRTGGSSLLQHFSDGGSAFSLHDLAVPMIVPSDNTATNMLIDVVGMERVNRTMASLGFAQTKLQRKMIRPEASARGEENVSTPREAVDFMVRLARCDLPLTPASCAEVRRLLELPKGGEFRQPIPAAVFQHFALVAGATPFGTRVDPTLVKKPGTGSRACASAARCSPATPTLIARHEPDQ